MTLYLVDKSAWEWASRDSIAKADLTAIVSELSNTLAATHVTALEVGYSATSLVDYQRRLSGQRHLEWLPVTEAAMDRALAVQAELAAQGQHRRPIPDLIIAATAEVHGATVLHVDKDYDLLAAVTGQPTYRLSTSAA